MLTAMTEDDWAIVLQVFRAVRSRRGDKGRDDRKFLEALHYFTVYPVHVMTRKSFGLMMRKLSVTESQRSAQFPGTFSRRKLSVASANWAQVA